MSGLVPFEIHSDVPISSRNGNVASCRASGDPYLDTCCLERCSLSSIGVRNLLILYFTNLLTESLIYCCCVILIVLRSLSRRTPTPRICLILFNLFILNRSSKTFSKLVIRFLLDAAMIRSSTYRATI